jgi:hypothetical protein
MRTTEILSKRMQARQLVNQMRLFGRKRTLVVRFTKCWKEYNKIKLGFYNHQAIEELINKVTTN